MPTAPPSARTTSRRYGLRAAVVAGWALAVVLLWDVVATGRDAFAAAVGLPAMAVVTVLAAGRLGLPVPPWNDDDPKHRYRLGSAREAAAGILLRAVAWPLFALQAAGTPGLPFPAWGDLALVAQTSVLVVAVLATEPRRSAARSLRLGVDAVLTAFGLVLVLWVLVVGPGQEFVLVDLRVLLGLALCLALLLQVALVALVVVREPVTHGATAVLATAALTATELAVVLTAFGDGVRHVPWPLAVLWVAGWLAMTGSILVNRSLPVESLSAEEAERREVRSTDLATGVVVVSVFVAVIGQQTIDGAPAMPGGWLGAGLVLVGVSVFAARESLLGRLRARLTSQLRRQARVDPLTGLANRRGLTEHLRRIPQGAEWAVLALDLDGFKAVNDVHGHAAGDDVLVVVADVLRALGPADGLAARTGGDEFTVLTPGDVTTARQLGVRVAAAVREQLAALGLGPRITVSVGVGRVGADDAEAGPHPVRQDRLAAVVEAAAALRSAKDLGRDRVQVYPGLVARQRERRLLVEARLREALRHGGVVAVGQPIVDLSTGAVVAVEALARWEDELLGRVPPAEFVLVAERSGLVADVGRAALRSAVGQYGAQGLVGSGIRLAVNVSPLELRGPGYVEGLAEVLAEHGMPGRDLVVEVTEAVVIEAGDPAVRVLSRLNDLGVQIAIDDFGTGYSALGYLRRLPVQALKVDKSLVAEALTSVRTREIVSGVVDLARRLGLLVTLEGIEDARTARLAHELGADHGQGFALGRPVPWPEITRRLRGDAASPGPPGADAG